MKGQEELIQMTKGKRQDPHNFLRKKKQGSGKNKKPEEMKDMRESLKEVAKKLGFEETDLAYEAFVDDKDQQEIKEDEEFERNVKFIRLLAFLTIGAALLLGFLLILRRLWRIV